MRNLKNESDQKLQNSTMKGFVESLNGKLEKAGLPLASMPSRKKQQSKAGEYHVKFINDKKCKND